MREEMERGVNMIEKQDNITIKEKKDNKRMTIAAQKGKKWIKKKTSWS